jgi:hypothetical protein
VCEEKAVAVAEHLAEGCSLKATARLSKVHPSVVRRLNGKVGQHGEVFHDEHVQSLEVEALQADERHGYFHDKSHPQWEAEVIEPQSKFILWRMPHSALLTAIAWSCSLMVKPATRAYFQRFLVWPIVQHAQALVVVFLPQPTASREVWPMCRLSNIEREGAS